MSSVAVFIDGAYVDAMTAHEFTGQRIDYQALAEHCTDGMELLRAYYYDSLPHQGTPPTQQERERMSQKQRFFHALNRLPRFQVREGKCAKRSDSHGNVRYEQKRVDILIAVDLVLLAVKQRITLAALITGDSDLLPAVEIARNEGVVVHLYHSSQYHNELWDACDERTGFTSDLMLSLART